MIILFLLVCGGKVGFVICSVFFCGLFIEFVFWFDVVYMLVRFLFYFLFKIVVSLGFMVIFYCFCEEFIRDWVCFICVICFYCGGGIG